MARLDKLLWGDGADPRLELEELFDSVPSARAWAVTALADAGVDAADEVRAIRALRAAEPRLSLKPATYLVAQIRS